MSEMTKLETSVDKFVRQYVDQYKHKWITLRVLQSKVNVLLDIIYANDENAYWDMADRIWTYLESEIGTEIYDIED